MRTLIVTFLLIACMGNADSQTSIEGKVRDRSTFEPILFAGIALYKNGVLITGAETDLDGNFLISDIQPGKYDLEIGFLGYKKTRIEGILCLADEKKRLEVEMEVESELGSPDKDIIICKKLINNDSIWKNDTIITSEKIRTLPRKKIP